VGIHPGSPRFRCPQPQVVPLLRDIHRLLGKAT
jgi:hypothetical protein